MKRYLITGITGTLGQAVAKILLSDPSNEVIGYSRDECKQASLPEQKGLVLYLGDIRDKTRLIEASRNVDVIFHFAALKHVDILEENPEESISTNVIGTQNVLHAQRVNKISRVILSATDKGCYPVNVYGMTKAIAEKLILRHPGNVVCRYGNVIASRGSAIPKFVQTLKEEEKVYITDPQMTRFWIPIQEAAAFVASQEKGKGGIKIPPMKGASIELVASAVAEIMNIKSYYTQYVGMRPGEKIHECLQMAHEGELIESHTSPQFTKQELIDLLTPTVKGLL